MVAGERRAAGQRLEQDAAEREHVGARPDVAIAARLLRRHVAGRADHHAGSRREPIATRNARDPEVEHFDLFEPCARQEDVARLDVSVNDAERVRGAERFGDSPRQLDRLGRGHAEPQPMRQALAVEPFHREPQLAVRDAVGDVANDAGMAELSEHADLARESIEVNDRIGPQDLDRDRLADGLVDGAIDRAHPAGPGHAFEPEPSRDEIAGLHPPETLPDSVDADVRVVTLRPP